ncbi:GH1 family beta-glucosidase [Streptomyces sp. NPDC059949]|uniref:GH1 family beta-glucosidase n=1 Tax=Streptomyces sp. NPDC059949 TaxID=3347013 RepID=UPI00366518EE
MNSPAFPTFPEGFVFGAATAAYQIEGAAAEDGRGPSVWDTYSRLPGNTAHGHTGDIACDHYHRYAEDVRILKELGVDSYRFSIAWPRIQPQGSGPVNPAGLDFYDRLVDELLAAGIEPAATLYHWDLPQALEDRGGWRVRESAELFGEYAGIMARRLGDRVPRWITLNEPWCSAFLGYSVGRHAPGAREGTPALAAAHHLLVGHGHAVSALRAEGVREVGITLNPDWNVAATGSDADRAAVVRADTQHNLVWTDPLFAGAYPASERETWQELIEDQDFRREGDLELISQPLDFVGVNYYRPTVVADAPHREADPALRTASDNRYREVEYPGVRHTAMGWPVAPGTFTELLVAMKQRYGDRLPPVHITENGSAEHDALSPDGQVHDADRVQYLADHLAALRAAMDEGVDVRGYYVWSLLDNFEWALGYDKRFGIVRVDFETQARTPKDSYRWYRELIAAHR